MEVRSPSNNFTLVPYEESAPEKGFSLVELLIALLCAAALASAAIYTLPNLIRDVSPKQAIQELFTLLEQAQLTSLRSQQRVSVVLSEKSIQESYRARELPLSEKLSYRFQFSGTDGKRAIHLYPSGSASVGRATIKGDTQCCILIQAISGARRWECVNAC